MISTSTGLPTAITTNSATAVFRLGELYETWDATYGDRVWRYVQNKSGADYTAGLGVMQENGTDLYESTVSGANTPNVRMFGVAQHTITNAYFGFVLASGMGVVASNGTTSANTVQVSAAAGVFTDGTAVTSENCVWALEAEAVASATFAAIIRCPL
jgi:hypothetical protein